LVHAVASLAAGGNTGSGKTVGHVGSQCHQLEKVASVQGQFINIFFRDDRAHSRVLGGESRGQGAHLYRLVGLPDNEGEIHPGRLLHLNFHGAGRSLKA
jgi:hypothetical protein